MNKGINNFYKEIAKTYDFVNHVFTLGIDIYWRNEIAKLANTCGGKYWLDMCTGTGKTAFCLSKNTSEDKYIFAADFSQQMICEAKKNKEAKRINFTLADATSLPFKDNSFDVVTISFATRNLNTSKDELINCFKEFYRILKPGGSLINTETSQPENKTIKWFYHKYADMFIKPLGILISGYAPAYNYFSKSIKKFYSYREFENILKKAGFSEINNEIYLFGIVAMHKAIK